MIRRLNVIAAAVLVAGCAANETVAVDESVGICPEMQPVVASPPHYPAEALMAGETGSVEIRFDVAPNGMTANHEVVSSTTGRTFNAAAIRAIEKWRFPASADGCRSATYTISFEIDQGTDWPPKTQ